MKRLIKTEQLTALFKSHVKELLREPEVLFWGIVFPLLMALGLGIAFTQNADTERNIAIIKNDSLFSKENKSALKNFLENKTEKVEDENGSKNNYKLTVKYKKLGNTDYIFYPSDWDNAIVLLKRGEISLIIRENEKGIKYHFDPANPDGQLTYLRLSRVIENKENTGETNVEPMTITGTRYIDFLIPGLLSMGVMMSSVWGLSYNLIIKRSKKLLRRMIATPMKKSHFLISLMIVRFIMNLLEASLLFFFAYLVFGVTVQGSVGALLLVFIAGNIAFAGIATLISSRTSNTEVGNGLINAVSTPMIVLSGIFFSYHNFPDVVIPFIKVLPLTLLADAIRSIFIEGAGFSEIALPFFVLFAIGITLFSIGLKIFRWH